MLVTTKSLLGKAQKEGYAVGAFNTYNLEITTAIVRAGVRLNSPLIIQTTEKGLAYAGSDELPAIIKTIAKKVKIPVALHLDHGKDFGTIKKCLGNGYTSIMFDGSKLDFAKNVALTKKAVALAHKKGIPVEAEIGVLKNSEENLTNPGQAKEFVKKTNADFLAVAIGTSHGAYKFKGKAKLDLKRLKEIKKAVNVPLVLHGASGVPKNYVALANKYGAKLEHTKGVPDSELKKAIKLGICKVNIDTDTKLAFNAALRKFLRQNPVVIDPREILSPVIDEMQKEVESKIKLFGSVNRA